MLRVSVSGLGYLGLVEVSASTTLAALRAILSQTFDADTLPTFYQFLTPGGVTVGTRREATALAAQQPSITLLPTSDSPLAGAWRARARSAAGRFRRCKQPPNRHVSP